MQIRFTIYAYIVISLSFFTLLIGPAFGGNADMSKAMNEIVRDVSSLKLGFGDYTLAHCLEPGQKNIAMKNLQENAYQGTYKFRDGNIFVVVDKETDTVIALYKRQENADKAALKGMVSELMDRFHEPTTMAHDQLIYWAYSKEGIVSDEVFNKAKKAGTTSGLNIVASVKFSSSTLISPDSGENTEDNDPKSTIYFIIASDSLLKLFVELNTAG